MKYINYAMVNRPYTWFIYSVVKTLFSVYEKNYSIKDKNVTYSNRINVSIRVEFSDDMQI